MEAVTERPWPLPYPGKRIGRALPAYRKEVGFVKHQDIISKAFRYFNVKTNKFEIDGGEYDLLVGASVADIKLSATVTVQSTEAPVPYDMAKLPSYASGQARAGCRG